MASLAFFQSLPLHAPMGVLVALTIVAEDPESCQAYAWQWYLFFSFLTFLLEVSLVGKKFDGFVIESGRVFLIRLL